MKKLLFLAFALLSYALDVPALESRVVDNAGLLSPDERKQLISKLESIEQNTSNQIAILTLPTLEEEALESYTIKVVESWQLGQKGKDNGVLILLVNDSHDIRIEVGYGLEGALPDGLCGSIIRNDMTPRFKEGKFFEGLSAGVQSIDQATRGEYEADEPLVNENVDYEFVMGLFAGLFGVLGIVSKMSKILGAILGAGGATLLAFIFLTQSTIVLGIIAFIGAILGAIAGAFNGFIPIGRSGGGGSFGGGFRGGGGGFGGGGAGGKW